MNALVTSAVRAGTVTNAGAVIAAHLCPMLDSLTQAAVSAALSNRATASAQLNSTFSLADGLMSIVQSPDVAAALDKQGLVLQTSIFRFQSQLTKAKASVDSPATKNATALKAVLKAVSRGQRLKALLLTVPFSNTVVMVSETKSSSVGLHYSGDTVCFHVDVLNATSNSSCGTVNVSADQVGGDPMDVLVIGSPSMSSPTDFCLTMGPDAGTLRVTVTTCGQTNSMLLYDYGVPRKSGPPLTAPQDLYISSYTADSMDLAWTYTATNADGFKVERGTSASGPWTPVGIANSTTTYEDSGLSNSTTYYYRVRAYDRKGYSAYSNSANGTTSAAISDSPGGSGETPVTPTPSPTPTPTPSPAPAPAPSQTPSPSPTSMSADEFNGPFGSWADLKANYGAKGDGVVDDTSALQSALNDLGKSGHAAVLYIPAGTYLITSTVTLQSQQYVSMIGADPSTTTLKWGGATGGVLLHIDGVAYSLFDRLTFAGSGTAGVLVDQSLTSAGSYFDTGNEYADDVFQDAGIGIRAGNNGQGAAESSVLRCQFLRHTVAGIILKNFNALDWFIWYCTFADNYDGVSNNPGAGNFHVFGSFFQRSTNADIDISDLGLLSFRYNTSIGSKQFFVVPNTWANGAEITFQGNTIADTTSDTAISIGTMGPVFLIDNVIASRSNATAAAFVEIGYDTAGLVAVGNTFTVNNPMTVTSSMGTSRFINVDNQIVARSSLTITAPTPPGVLPNNNRTVFEIPAGSSDSTIQTAINQAVALSGQRPVVHLAQGAYTILSTLTVPANADVQIIGDGGLTDLRWGGAEGTSPVIELAGPSRAILRDFMIQTYGKSAGIQVDNADQTGARIFMEQATLTRGLTAGLLVDQLDNAVVELHDFYPSQTSISPAVTGTGLKVVGGANAAAGNPLGGRTSVFAGATSDNYLSFEVVSGGSLLVNDVWYEGTGASTFAHVADNSTFTVDNSRMALPQTGYSVRMDNLSGKASVLSCQPDAPVGIFGTGTGTAWVAGNESHGPSSYFSDTATSTLGVFSDNRWYDTSYGSRSVPDQGTADANLVRSMLAHIRSEKPLSQTDVLPSGVTDLRLYRVFVDSAVTDIHLSP